jgi:hypothetical protein
MIEISEEERTRFIQRLTAAGVKFDNGAFCQLSQAFQKSEDEMKKLRDEMKKLR